MSQNKKKLVLRQKNDSDQIWIEEILKRFWASTNIVSRGRVHDASLLPSLIAEFDAVRVGLLTYNIENDECEIVSLNSLTERKGIGTALLKKLEKITRQLDCKRIWLITANDNSHAIDFYKKREFELIKIHQDAVTDSRKLKPEIPLFSEEGIPIQDEYEFEKILDAKDNA